MNVNKTLLAVNLRGNNGLGSFSHENLFESDTAFEIAVRKMPFQTNLLIAHDHSSLEKLVDKESFVDTRICLTMDHSMTYHFLKATRKQYPDARIGLVVLDQHIDLYSASTHGDALNRANVFRLAFEKRLLDAAVFGGIRSIEYAANLKSPNPILDIFVKKHRQRYHSDINSIIENVLILTAQEIQRDCRILVDKACFYLKNKNIDVICFSVDLDGFDSDEIRGVEYNRSMPFRIFKLNPHNRMVWFESLFIGLQLREPGLRPNTAVSAFQNVVDNAHSTFQALGFFEITELSFYTFQVTPLCL